MNLLLALALVLYALPLAATTIAAFVAAGGSEHSFVYAAAAACQFYQKNLELVLGNILTPLVTALAVTPRDLQATIPSRTKVIIGVFVLLLAITGIAYAQLSSHDAAVREYGTKAAQAFYDLADRYAHQLATFLALAFGIAARTKQ